jgi:hypothetical protein
MRELRVAFQRDDRNFVSRFAFAPTEMVCRDCLDVRGKEGYFSKPDETAFGRDVQNRVVSVPPNP